MKDAQKEVVLVKKELCCLTHVYNEAAVALVSR